MRLLRNGAINPYRRPAILAESRSTCDKVMPLTKADVIGFLSAGANRIIMLRQVAQAG